ncbi:MAG: biopolymer transporter ExbD [Pirellulaceae bacterium]|nr:biopolymer transporter ExbD [Pirellulaceae bacterium]
MRFRSRLALRIPLDMTPLIDIVFQLLVFFILTLRIAQPEGDFDIAPPHRRPETAQSFAQVPPLVVVLRASDEGSLAAVSLNGRSLAGLSALHDEVAKLLAGDPQLAAEASVELSCDEALAYDHTMAAITAVSGTRLADGSIRPLVSRVNFR